MIETQRQARQRIKSLQIGSMFLIMIYLIILTINMFEFPIITQPRLQSELNQLVQLRNNQFRKEIDNLRTRLDNYYSYATINVIFAILSFICIRSADVRVLAPIAVVSCVTFIKLIRSNDSLHPMHLMLLFDAILITILCAELIMYKSNCNSQIADQFELNQL